MIPIHLFISGFLSYRQPAELDFTQFDLACISGPNGAGKSALLDAMTFALFGQARARGDALINTHKDVKAAEVALTFQYEGNLYRVQRIAQLEKPTLLEFQIQTGEDKWKALTERTLRDTEARIYETLRLDYETFVNASFFLQGAADQFTQQRPAERKRILGNVLGLEIWETYRQRAVDRRKVVEGQISVLQGRLQEIAQELDQEAQRKTRLEELQTQLAALSDAHRAQKAVLDGLRDRISAVEQQRALVDNLAGQLERTQTQLDENAARLEERRAEQAGYAALLAEAKEIEAEFKKWLALREEVARLDGVAAQFREQESRRAAPLRQIETEQARLETELENLRKEEANLQQLLATKPGLDKEKQTLEAEIARMQEHLGKQGEWETQLKQQRALQTKVETENPLLKDEMVALKAKIVQMQEAKGAAACPTCGQPLTEEHRVSVIDELETEGKQMGDRYRANNKDREQVAKRIEKLEGDLGQLAQLKEQLSGKTVRLAELNTRLSEIVKVEASWAEQRAPRLAEVAAALEQGGFAAEARAALAAVDAELKQTGYDAAAHDAARQQELAARPVEERMRALESAKAASKPLEREIKDLEKQQAALEKDLAAQRPKHQQAVEALAPLAEGLPDVEALERALLETQERENQARTALGAAQQEVDVLDTLRTRRAEYQAERETLAGQVAQFQALERAFGKDGVPAMLIEQALPQIESKANELLERLSAGTMNIRFVTQQKYKDSKREDLRETLDIQISDRAGEREYEMFSGGEAFRINFAIRLALSEVLAQRAGARLQTLVIDEGFGSQDEPGRQRLVEAISQVRQDFAKILVITHIDALKDAFPNRIEVEKGPEGSVLRVV
ncbi:MAG: SMC family ATPase [Anaerolineales bacterium]|nr:SMC family ATPase [Anaerolineales bacterium]